jgi:CheY-like chemotaxis protein
MSSAPIIIIDDDDEDLELIQQALEELKVENEVIIFNDGYKFLDFIKQTHNKAFFILCDINMSKISGLELKKEIYEDDELRLKCVPFVFMSTSRASDAIMKAYSYGVQGYFVKPNSFGELKDMLQSMINYWGYSQKPNT